MEPQEVISSIIDQLLQQAKPRPDLITPGSQTPGLLSMPRPATLFGRVIQPGQKVSAPQLLRELPPQVPGEEEWAAPVGLLPSASFGATIQNLARRLKGKWPTQVVGKEGEPKVVYHGTPAGFKEFDPGKAKEGGLYGPGFYFTEDPEIAGGVQGFFGYSGGSPNRNLKDLEFMEQYWSRMSKQAANRIKEATDRIEKESAIRDLAFAEARLKDIPRPNVRPVFLNIKKVFDIDASDTDKNLLNNARILLKDPSYKPKTNAVLYDDLVEELGSRFEVSDWLNANGYDGITHIGGKISGGKPHRVWIVFNPEQIISPFDPSLHK